MDNPHTRRIAGTALAVVVGAIAVLLNAGVVNSLLITLLLEVIALQLSSDEQRHTHNQELVAAIELGQEISESGEQRDSLRSLVSNLATVAKGGHPLFVRQATERLVAFVDEIRRLSHGVMTITDSREIQMEGIWLLEHLASDLFATSVISMDTFWTESRGPDYHHKNLEVLERERTITRVFILDSAEALKDPRLRSLLQEQLDAGVQVRHVWSEKLPLEAIADFGIWDDKLVCTLRPTPNSPGDVLDATYDTTPAGLQNARALRELILHASDQLTATPSTLQTQALDDRDACLRASAPIMRHAAKEHCVGGYVDSRSCCWYHEAWQYLKLIRLVEAPRLHEEFFSSYISKYVQSSKAPRILVCGLADYEMCAVVLDALGEMNQQDYQLTVLDVCDTPLRNAEWYAEREQRRLVTRRADARDTGLDPASFDLIVTDAFLTKLSSGERQEVISEWLRLLPKGGQVLTTVKIGKGSLPEARATDQQARAYADAAAQAVSSADFITPDEIKRLAHEYARRNISYPLEDDQDVRGLFSGFDVSVISMTPVSEYAISYYAQLTAVKTAVG